MSMAVVAVPRTAADVISPASFEAAVPSEAVRSAHLASATRTLREVRTIRLCPPGALSNDQLSAPRNAKAKPAPRAPHAQRSATSRRKIAATAVKPSTVRKWTRKKRGLIGAGDKSNREQIRPQARRRQKSPSIASPRAVHERH